MSKSKKDPLEQLKEDIAKLIKKEIEDNTALLRINVGTHGGTLISSEFREEGKLSEEKIASATSSMDF